MISFQQKFTRHILVLIGAGLLAACASNSPAPVEVRTAVKPTQPTAPVQRPGYYIVKQGDTLYSIARQFSRDVRELAQWNGLSDPSVISRGQELRVSPPQEIAQDGGVSSASAESLPVPSPVVIGSAPVQSSAIAPVAGASGTLLTEPKGGRIAYSEQAWKDLTQNRTDKPEASTSAPVAQASSSSSAHAPVAEGGWVWPAKGKVIASFNDSSNKGVDLGGDIGEDVVAAEGGEVKYVGSSLRGYGNLVIIKHNNDYSSVYAHNQEILVKENQQVRKGQKIATLGKSDADRPKLHFEIRKQGKPVDPLKYLPSR